MAFRSKLVFRPEHFLTMPSVPPSTFGDYNSKSNGLHSLTLFSVNTYNARVIRFLSSRVGRGG